MRIVKFMSELVSVIIPVYNVEKYIKRCVVSVLSQTYTNLEIWLVDDGSTDGSPAICDELALMDERIKVIHKQNGGLSDARNTALDLMTGEYVTFVDSDDAIHISMVERLISIAIKEKAEIVSAKLVKWMGDSIADETVQFNETSSELELYRDEKVFEPLFNRYELQTVTACGKLYSTKVFENTKFTVGKIHEDEFIIHHLLGNAKVVVMCNEALYYHFYRNDSITNSKYTLKNLDAVYAIEDRISFFEDRNEERYSFLSKKSYLRRVQFHYYSLKKYYPDEKAKVQNIVNRYKELYRSIKGSLTKGERIRYGLFITMPFVNKLLKGLMGARKI